jgi:uncharacterized spore protein YtfJ
LAFLIIKRRGYQMIDLQQLQIIAQLVDSLEIASDNLEKAKNDSDSEEFNKYTYEILNLQKKISEISQK